MNFDLFKSSEDDFMVPSNSNFSVILYYTFPSWKGGNWNSRGQREGAECSARKYSTFISNLIQNGSHWRNVVENGIEIIQIQSAALLSTDSGNSSFLKYLQIQSRGSFRIEHKVTLSDPELHWGMEAAIHS